MNDDLKNPQPDSAVYKTLLESTRAIPWVIDWESAKFTYIGPQIEALLGWSQDSWITVQDWAERIHEEDRERVVNYCISQSQCGIDHEADYQALKKNGEYIWIRDVVHVVRKENGDVESLIGFMFDISERKKTEQQLVILQKELEELSFKDSLTGVPNRRMFDSILEQEWANARRNHQPLSVILLDIDYFKQYNDSYGHIRGDECLKSVAKALNGAATRSRDFFARFGGEEFVFILPETEEDAAKKIAERCRNLLFKLQIPHEKSQVSAVITASFGVGSIIPGHNDDPIEFIEKVDKRLYQAKQNGRNCVVRSN